MSTQDLNEEATSDAIEADIETVVASFEGTARRDPSAAYREKFLKAELERSRETVSVGYVRRGKVNELRRPFNLCDGGSGQAAGECRYRCSTTGCPYA